MKYGTILADPPWPETSHKMFCPDPKQKAKDSVRPFPFMTYDQIRNLRVAPLARPSSHLYLWATQRSLREAFSVIDAWGFDYKMTLTWCKKMGLGFHYFRHSSEFLLFAVRSCLATKQRNVGTWFQAPKGTHRQFAAKPDYSYQLIEDNSPGPYLELFARRRYSKKWDVWGDEIRSTVRLT